MTSQDIHDSDEYERTAQLITNYLTHRLGAALGITIAEEAYQQLTSIGWVQAANVAQSMLRDPDPYRRMCGAEWLLERGAKDALSLVLVLLEDADTNVRTHVCFLCYKYGNHQATTALARVLRADPDPDVRSRSAEALGAHGDQRALPALRLAIESDDGVDFQNHPIKKTAIWAIEQIQKRQEE